MATASASVRAHTPVRARGNAALAALAVGALGVVFGDIGTSPLYALQAVFGPAGLHLAPSRTNILGIISLIFWAITLVVSVKYVNFIMRAGNRGEGGIMALTALVRGQQPAMRRQLAFIMLGLAGVALFYGDSVITPAISVLSAVEGLHSVSPALQPAILPLTLVLLCGLCALQRYGTAAIGRLFGPIMLVWFLAIGLAGYWQVCRYPAVLIALSPLSAARFFAAQPGLAFVSLGAVILAVTGAEALYADMGHFGRPAIARAWFYVVFPCLILCYMGQAALMLHNPPAAGAPFMSLFPGTLQIPAVLLATAATLIASQSVISGAFSLTRQATHLDFLPKMRILHTSDLEPGQIYMPFVNLVMFVTVILLVLGFGSSARLAHAYGVAVSCTLLIDTILFLAVSRAMWRRRLALIVPAGLLFLIVDVSFAAANVPKIPAGGFFPLVLAALVFAIIRTWIRGQQIITRERRAMEGPLQAYIDKIRSGALPISRVPGCAVYIGHHNGYAPLALHAAVEKLHELHQKVVILTVTVTGDAHVPENRRAAFNGLAYDDGISQLHLTYGYHDSQNIPRALQALRRLSQELDFDPALAAYFISLSTVVPTRRRNMAGWRKALYIAMSQASVSHSDHFHLPTEQTVEMRSLIKL